MKTEDIQVGHSYEMRDQRAAYVATIVGECEADKHQDWLYWTQPSTFPHRHCSRRVSLAEWAVAEVPAPPESMRKEKQDGNR